MTTQRTPVFRSLDAAREYWKCRAIDAEQQRDELLAALRELMYAHTDKGELMAKEAIAKYVTNTDAIPNCDKGDV